MLYACSWPILLNTIAGVRTVDPLLIRSARSMGLSTLRLFQKVILPAAVPTIFTGVRLAGAYSILVLVAAEMVGAKAGLGYLINSAQYNFAIPDMYAGIITISAHRPGRQPAPGRPRTSLLHAGASTSCRTGGQPRPAPFTSTPS